MVSENHCTRSVPRITVNRTSSSVSSIEHVRSDQSISREYRIRFLKLTSARKRMQIIVAVDFFLAVLLWAVFTQIDYPEDFLYSLKEEVLFYSIFSSMFDTVMLAAFRAIFLFLLIIICHMHHWWVTSVTFAVTTALIISKAFLFCFVPARNVQHCGDISSDSVREMLSVLLLLTSFLFAFAQVYIQDSKLHTADLSLKEICGNGDPERAHLLDKDNYRSPFFSQYRTPLASDSEEEDDGRFGIIRSYEMEAAFALERLWELAILDNVGWVLQKSADDGVVEKKNYGGDTGVVFRLQVELLLSPKSLSEYMHSSIEDFPSWNETVVESRILRSFYPDLDLVYSVSAPFGGGAVSSRDFVCLRYKAEKENCFVSSVCSTHYAEMPPIKKYVRAHSKCGSGWVFQPVEGEPDKCKFIWISSADLKGWLPSRVVDSAMASAMLLFNRSLSNHIASGLCNTQSA